MEAGFEFDRKAWKKFGPNEEIQVVFVLSVTIMLLWSKAGGYSLSYMYYSIPAL